MQQHALLEQPTAYTMRRTILQVLRAARGASPLYLSFLLCTEPDDSVCSILGRGAYVALWASYYPVALMVKRWIVANPDLASQKMRRKAYQAFLKTYCACWPASPRNLYPTASYVPELVGLGVVAVAMMVWVETVDQELLPGPLALQLLATSGFGCKTGQT